MDAQLQCLAQLLKKMDIIIANQQGGEAEVIATLTCTQNDDTDTGTLVFDVPFLADNWSFTSYTGYSNTVSYNTAFNNNTGASYEDGVATLREGVPFWSCSSWSLTLQNSSTSNTAILYFDLHCAVGTTYTVMAVQK